MVFKCRRVRNFLAVNNKYNPSLQNSTRVKRPRNPSRCSYSMCSWIAVLFADTASNLCECSQLRIGPEICTSVKPESVTFLCWACQCIGNGPNHKVNFEWDLSANGSIWWIVRNIGGGVRSRRVRGSAWKSLTDSSFSLTVNENRKTDIRRVRNTGLVLDMIPL